MNHGICDRIVMIGNSRVRYLYDTFTDFFSYNKSHIKAHHDLQFENDIIVVSQKGCCSMVQIRQTRGIIILVPLKLFSNCFQINEYVAPGTNPSGMG